jgi:hypothetical protein
MRFRRHQSGLCESTLSEGLEQQLLLLLLLL